MQDGRSSLNFLRKFHANASLFFISVCLNIANEHNKQNSGLFDNINKSKLILVRWSTTKNKEKRKGTWKASTLL